MANIIVEDGTIVAGANSYLAEADLTAYALDRGITLIASPDVLIIQSMDYIESQRFKGQKLTQNQPLQWPRSGVVIDGYAVPENEIPQLLMDAVAEVSISIDGGTNPLANIGRETIREKVDVIEVEYSASARSSTYLTAAQSKLSKLIKSGMLYSGRVSRG